MNSKASNRLWIAPAGALALLVLWATPAMGQATAAARPGPPPPPADPAIAYIASGALMMMNADGSNKTVVVPAQSGVSHSDPNWSPDGQQLVFGSTIQGPGIYIVNRDGTGLKKVLATSGGSPAWSPVAIGANYMIAYSDSNPDHGGGYDLYAMNLDGSGIVNLTNTPDFNEFVPTWDPLATRLAATAWPRGAVTDPTGDLMVYDLALVNGVLSIVGQRNFGETGPLASYDMWRPDWAKTQDKIAFVAIALPGVDESNEIWVLDLADPNNPVQLTKTPDSEENMPTWSPEDSQIAYRRDGVKNRVSIFVMNADGSGAREIGFPGRRETQDRPDWRRNP